MSLDNIALPLKSLLQFDSPRRVDDKIGTSRILNLSKFFAELKRRAAYKVAISYDQLPRGPRFEGLIRGKFQVKQ